MKAVMLSIQPKWCELIASGKKTVEVRKTKPKIDVPFKCYIYCTKDNSFAEKTLRGFDENGNAIYYKANKGKVIGEFVCDKVVQFENDCYTPAFEETADLSCVGYEGLYDYLGAKEYGYGWHITDLVIYDKPKELSEFVTALSDKDIRCKHIKMRYTINGIRYFKCTLQNCVCEFRRLGHQTDCDGYEMLNPSKPITIPPQSWCYCEELKGETE